MQSTETPVFRFGFASASLADATLVCQSAAVVMPPWPAHASRFGSSCDARLPRERSESPIAARPARLPDTRSVRRSLCLFVALNGRRRRGALRSRRCRRGARRPAEPLPRSLPGRRPLASRACIPPADCGPGSHVCGNQRVHHARNDDALDELDDDNHDQR